MFTRKILLEKIVIIAAPRLGIFARKLCWNSTGRKIIVGKVLSMFQLLFQRVKSMKRSITNQDTLVSGGAVGADDHFIKCAQTRGDSVEICLGKKQKYSEPSEDHKVIRVGCDDYKD